MMWLILKNIYKIKIKHNIFYYIKIMLYFFQNILYLIKYFIYLKKKIFYVIKKLKNFNGE